MPVLLGAGMLLSCKNDLDEVAAVVLPAAVPDRETEEAEYLYTDAGVLRNRLRAARITEWNAPEKRTELDGGLELVFFDTIGQQVSVLTARRGTILTDQQRMQVMDDVVFLNAKGERLETELLTWQQDSARVRTDRAVRIQRGADVIHGMGLDAAEDFSSYVIKRVTGTLHLGDTLAAPR